MPPNIVHEAYCPCCNLTTSSRHTDACYACFCASSIHVQRDAASCGFCIFSACFVCLIYAVVSSRMVCKRHEHSTPHTPQSCTAAVCMQVLLYSQSTTVGKGHMLNMDNFIDTTNIEGRFEFSEWVRAYGKYLDEQLEVYQKISFYQVWDSVSTHAARAADLLPPEHNCWLTHSHRHFPWH